MFTKKSRNIYKAGSLCEFAKAFYWRDRCGECSKACVTERSRAVDGAVHSRTERNFLDEKIVGVYIYGSIALGAFHAETSDVDFVTVISDPVNEAENSNL